MVLLQDGATEDWLFAGVATELQVSSGLGMTFEPVPQYVLALL